MSRCLILIVTMVWISIFTVNSSVLSDSSFAFQAKVDPQWVIEDVDSNSRFLYDPSEDNKAGIYIERILIDTVSVLLQDEYAKIYFESNYYLAQNYGFVQYYDTSAFVKQGNLRAFELFAYYKDTIEGRIVWWAELCRWSSQGKYVYQITVLGDTSDITENIMKYIDVIDSIKIWSPGSYTKTQYHPSFSNKIPARSTSIIDLRGRLIRQKGNVSGYRCLLNQKNGKIIINNFRPK